jgi:Glycosyl transferase family 2
VPHTDRKETGDAEPRLLRRAAPDEGRMPLGHPLAQLRSQWNRVRTVRQDIRAARARTETLVDQSSNLAREVQACRAEVSALSARLDALAIVPAKLDEMAAYAAANHRRVIDALRVVRDDDARARAALWELRGSPGYARAFDEDEPLVTIIVTTYRNWPMLRDRCLPSILAQTYERFETIIVGDAAPPEADEVVRAFGDGRLRFVNLPYRGPYPKDPRDAWLVSGTTPFNTGLALARGSWIGSNSDDDALRPNHLESLLGLARRSKAEVAYGLIDEHAPDGGGTQLGVFPPEEGQWGIQCSLLHSGLRFLPLQPTDWLFGLPNDSSLLERMLRIGVRFAMLDEAVVDYYPSRLWTDRFQGAES